MSYAGLIPVMIYYENEDTPEPRRYAKGGLVVKAKEVRGAGRYGDTELIHVNRDELDELRLRWGEPTINPETGMPEFFLGGFGKTLLKIAKIAAPIAVSFIPGIGPIASAALGAAVGGGLGALGGGGLKGALTGAVTGGLGGFGGNAAGFGKVFAGAAKAAPTLTGLASNVATQMAPLSGATLASTAAPSALTGLASNVATQMAPLTTAAIAAPSAFSDLASNVTTQMAPLTTPATTAAAPAATTAATNVAATAAKPNFWNQQFLGLPIKNKIAIPLGVAALAASGALKGTPEEAVQKPEDFFQTGLGGKSTVGGTVAPATAQNTLSSHPLTDYANQGYMRGYQYFSAKGGEVDGGDSERWHPSGRVNASTRGGADYGVTVPIGNGALSVDALADQGMIPRRLAYALEQPVGPGRLALTADASRGAKPNRFGAKYTLPFEGGGGVDGDGTGRDDKIDARLSDGEYVMDAETVAMLGDGSTKAGAKALDDFRVKIRKHKGAKLAKGAISAKAKAPDRYLAGARV